MSKYVVNDLVGYIIKLNGIRLCNADYSVQIIKLYIYRKLFSIIKYLHHTKQLQR